MICRQILDPAADVGVGSFVLIYGVATTLQSTMKSLFSRVIDVATTGKYVKDYYDLLQYDSEELSGVNDPIPRNAEITFENVSFHYPNTYRWVLKDISVTIKPGEKMPSLGKTDPVKVPLWHSFVDCIVPRKVGLPLRAKTCQSPLG